MIRFALFILLLVFALFPGFLTAQNQTVCEPKTSQFDFWIGKWNVEWANKDGTTGKGTNEIKLILNGCVIEENFDATTALNFEGKSFSVYNKNISVWQQTWVDDQGSYMAFTGGMTDGKMILSRNITIKEKEIIQRMVFYNITDKEFDWNWERSDDYAKTWQLNWKIHYSRIQ